MVNIVKEKWDFLIILDACRYDYFETMYKDYLQGDLEKKISAGSCTNDWRDVNFPDNYDDIVYLSANPFFAQDQSVLGYTAGEHFHKVYELWRDGWQRGTVPPEVVTNAAPEIIAKHPDKRFIIHYLQPHAPYLVLGEDAIGYDDPQGQPGRCLAGKEDYQNSSRYKRRILKWLMRLFKWNNLLGNHPDWLFCKWLNLPPRSSMEYVVRQYNTKVLRKAYKQNLRLALEQVQYLLKHLKGRIIITADHGELLGENLRYAHPPNSKNPILLEVPWLVINKPEADTYQPDVQKLNIEIHNNSSKAGADQTDEQQIKNKLRDLGYLD
jgi:hypothetical protein